MRGIKTLSLLAAATTLLAFQCRLVQAAEEKSAIEINTGLMLATFRIQGEGSSGTAFIVRKPNPEIPTRSLFVLVTAAHVLGDMKGDLATIVLRHEVAPAVWENSPGIVKIREKNRELWTKHPEADIAVIPIGSMKLPNKDFRPKVIPIDMLADDDLLAKHEIHPGDEVNCLGYPFSLNSGRGDFPVLRSGKIASYPILPTKKTKSFLLDIPVFPGNSGGPVYISYTGSRISGKVIRMDTQFQFVMGLVSQERIVTQQIKELYATREQRYSLGLAEIIHASLIREAIELLPFPDDITD
jgi:S1-C subfamily serine protease